MPQYTCIKFENGTHVAGLAVALTHIGPDGAKKTMFSEKTDAGTHFRETYP